jgi:hypothetical protein
MIFKKIARLQTNAQVPKIRSAHMSSSSCDTVRKGELDELGPLATKLVP